jgi:Flp pilus assembly protein TadD
VPLHELEPLYRLALAIFNRLAQADPGNAGWQRDLSVSYEKVGDVLVAQGNLPEALKAFRDSHNIFNRLAQADPGNAGWQGDLIVSYVKLAGIDQTGARTFLTQAQQIAEGMQQRGQLAPRDLWILDALATRLAALPS